MKHIDKKGFKVFLCVMFLLIFILLFFLILRKPSVENERYYYIDGKIYGMEIRLSENGDFLFHSNLSSYFPKENATKQYYYKDDMLILEYNNGMMLYFKVDSNNDTLIFQKDLSYYPYELAKEVFGGEVNLSDGSVFERYYYPEE